MRVSACRSTSNSARSSWKGALQLIQKGLPKAIVGSEGHRSGLARLDSRSQCWAGTALALAPPRGGGGPHGLKQRS